jgi:hypothetical protein
MTFIAPFSDPSKTDWPPQVKGIPYSPQWIRPKLGGHLHFDSLVVGVQASVASGSRRLLQCLTLIENLFQRPGPISDSRRHRGSSALQGLMSPAKVVIGEVERERGIKVLPLLAERVRQTGQPPHAHAHRKVLPLDMRRADLLLIWVPVDRSWNRLSQARRTVAPCVFGNIEGIDLDQLRIVHALSLVSEYVSYGGRIGRKSIGRELELPFRISRGGQLPHETSSAAHGSFAQVISEDKFGVPFYGDESPCVSDVREVALTPSLVPLLLLNEAPDFIALDILRWNPANRCGEHRFTAFASSDEHLLDRAMMQSSDARRAANAVAFANELDREQTCICYQAALRARFVLMRFGVGFSAMVAAKSLQPVAVFAKALAINTTVVARHSDLELSSGRSHNGRGLRNPALDFGLRLTPSIVSSYWRGLIFVRRSQRGRRELLFPFRRWRSCRIFRGASLIPKKLYRSGAQPFPNTLRKRWRSVDLFPVIGNRFFAFASLNDALQNHVNCCLRISITAEVMPKIFQHQLDRARRSPERIVVMQDGPDFVSKCGVLQQVNRFRAGINIKGLGLAKCGQSIDCLTQFHFSFLKTLFTGKQFGQFALGCFVGP